MLGIHKNKPLTAEETVRGQKKKGESMEGTLRTKHITGRPLRQVNIDLSGIVRRYIHSMGLNQELGDEVEDGLASNILDIAAVAETAYLMHGQIDFAVYAKAMADLADLQMAMAQEIRYRADRKCKDLTNACEKPRGAMKRGME
jgi:hypothetical protein